MTLLLCVHLVSVREVITWVSSRVLHDLAVVCEYRPMRRSPSPSRPTTRSGRTWRPTSTEWSFCSWAGRTCGWTSWARRARTTRWGSPCPTDPGTKTVWLVLAARERNSQFSTIKLTNLDAIQQAVTNRSCTHHVRTKSKPLASRSIFKQLSKSILSSYSAQSVSFLDLTSLSSLDL